MQTRRQFLVTAAAATAAASLAAPHAASAQQPSAQHYRVPHRFGLGGVAIGNAFAPLKAEQSDEVMRAAWAAGVRYFDTSPWYGLGLSERRMGHVLADHPRNEFVISTKVGRLLTAAPSPTDKQKTMWKSASPFSFRYDYTADGTKRSIEDSLQRLGLAAIDVVFIHDLSPDHFGEKWTEHFEVAARGAIPTLTRMRDEGVIKGWGFGVNNVEPCLRALEVGDPDVFLLATQYSLVKHDAPLKDLFPKCDQRGVSIVVGAPFNSGLLAGKERYNYRNKVPPEIKEKAERIAALANEHGTDLRTASLQFCAAPKVVCSVIPGASSGKQVEENVKSMSAKIPAEFWSALKREKLIVEAAATPG
jgi:D-threo-aldose 1-dehydrogenase